MVNARCIGFTTFIPLESERLKTSFAAHNHRGYGSTLSQRCGETEASQGRLLPPIPRRNGGDLGGDDHGVFMDGPRWRRYRQSKLANMLFTYALHDRLQVPRLGCRVQRPPRPSRPARPPHGILAAFTAAAAAAAHCSPRPRMAASPADACGAAARPRCARAFSDPRPHSLRRRPGPARCLPLRQARGSRVRSLAAAPGMSATNLIASNAGSDGDSPGLLATLIFPIFALWAQSAEDGTMPLLHCIAAPDALSGEFYEPADGDGRTGLARRIDKVTLPALPFPPTGRNFSSAPPLFSRTSHGPAKSPCRQLCVPLPPSGRAESVFGLI